MAVSLREEPSSDAAAHRRWVDELLLESEDEYSGAAGTNSRLLVIGNFDLKPIGETRWSDLREWYGRFTGDAWGGGLGGPLEDLGIGVGFAAVVSVGSTSGGVAADLDSPRSAG